MKVIDFQVVHFTELDAEGKPRQCLIIYALGKDGDLYEFSGGNWLRIPIKDAEDFEPKKQQKL